MTGQRQSVPARHGIATFVPKGHSIKVINTYGSQVISTWVFALHKPPTEESEAEERAAEEAFNQAQQEAEREVNAQLQQPAAGDIQPGENTSDVVVVDKHEEPVGDQKMPSQDEAQTTTEAPAIPTAKPTIQTVDGKKVRSWSSYVPSVPSVSALRYRSKASAAQASKDAAKISEEQGEGSSKDNAEVKPEELKKDGTESKETDKVEAVESEVSDHAAQADDEGVKVAGTTTPSDKSEDDYTDAKSVQSSRSWGSYLPSIRARAKAAYGMDPKAGTGDKEKGSQRTWLSYLPSGASFTSYLPSNSKDALSAFASSHHRDPTKSYAEQLYEFSKTPVGAASLSAATGSGTAGSLYAAYSAYTKLQAARSRTEPMEYLSLPHTIDALHKLSPEPGDTLISNLHEPLLTLLEDTSPPTTTVATDSSSSAAAAIPLRHGTILPACDPTTYKNLAGPDANGEEHGSCAENLVLALQEFNKSTGLKGPRTVGADVTLNSAPVPLSLFMNTSVQQQQQQQQGQGSGSSGSGNVVVEEPRKFEGGKWGKGGEKGGWVKFRAERDVVVIMSACPMDVGPTNAGRCMAANFVVEEPVCEEKVEEEKEEGEKGEEKGKEKAKVQTTSEQINGKKVEAKKAQVKKEVKKPAAATPAAAAAAATPAPDVKGKRRDSAHGIAEGAQPKAKKTPVEDRAKSPTENTAKATVENKTKTPVESRAKTPIENRAKTPVENRAKSPVENRAKSPVERVKSPFGNIVKNPFENRAKSPVSGVQSPRTGASTPCSEAIRNMPRPGKKKPKKLERRSSSKAPV
ncbi:hypothetical protein BFW01_g8581 [Lasiodiplodia theobromae]|nr:hypothetical protein BFW01_g8581 [Lasiodiplodia theobromae]